MYSIKYLKSLYYLSRFILIIPPYNLKILKPIKLNWASQLLRFAVILTVLTVTCFNTLRKLLVQFHESFCISCVLQSFTTFILPIISIYPIIASIKKLNVWNAFMENLLKSDKLIVCKSKNQMFLYVEVLIINLFNMYLVYFWFESMKNRYTTTDCFLMFFFTICQYVVVSTAQLMGHVADLLTDKFWGFNQSIYMKNYKGKMYSFYTNETIYLYFLLKQLVVSYNKIFGISLTLTILYPMFRILHVVYVVYFTDYFDIRQVGAYYLQISLWMVSFFIIYSYNLFF